MQSGDGCTVIGISGSGGILDDGLDLVLRRAGFTTLRYQHELRVHRCDLLIVRLNEPATDTTKIRRLAEDQTPLLILGPWNRDIASTAPSAHWLSLDCARAELFAAIREAIDSSGQDLGFRQPQRAANPLLSSRERAVVASYALGRTVREVSAELGVAPTTVSTHLDRARAKYAAAGRGAGGKIGLLRCALEDGLVECPCNAQESEPLPTW
ncbi:response regulator transcription factor [Hoyosella rhizosphaerae]|uniref:HTH luxR-type domain-containing protein n=1 Tax=Hoyosella rhizosphaerae TaxID=1755582 RepID=A0A916XDJ7_9ACTN|nr:LuxR C-terminal-related transcriptional regulator [Hoyosella rhizosphaerae]MBN4927525.1 response regulator transcription factor [Hoyosella rhizosphaerae]GGC63807.1 hypothetical protein GCM10011410_15300 [Hoyosella rhizosphaerae]